VGRGSRNDKQTQSEQLVTRFCKAVVRTMRTPSRNPALHDGSAGVQAYWRCPVKQP